jgi:predicted DsbA family dithiol-disulfide isomerase
MPATARYYTDPACSWSWGAEPKLRRLMWEFGDELRFVWVMGGLAREYGPGYRDEDGSIGSGPDCFADLMAHWLDVGAETGMPIDARLWTRNKIFSTYPACLAVKAAAEQGQDAAGRYLRRLREGLMLECRKLDHIDAFIGEAGPAGLDVERFRIDLSSNAITEAFAADLEEVRDPPAAAREAKQVRRTEGRERVSFPSMLFVAEDGSSSGVWGWQPYEAYREAALAAGAQLTADRPPEPAEVVERFGRVTTKEIEVITDRPRPVVEAELWAAARDWALKPVAVSGGTIWEKA